MATGEMLKYSAPELYDRYMAPLFFEPCADIVAELSGGLQPKTILETAAGTGIVTRAVHRALPAATIVSTDLNPAMLQVAEDRLHSELVSYRVENAQDLSFDDQVFDLVLSQFGIMFFPDRVRANSEARRVLGPGGHYIVVTFDALERSPVAKVVQDAVSDLFPDDPLTYMERGPYSYTDPDQVRQDLLAAGFGKVEIQTMAALSRAASAYEAAFGICQGGPFRAEIEKRNRDGLDRATDAAAKALSTFEGPNGLEAPMSAHFAVATK